MMSKTLELCCMIGMLDLDVSQIVLRDCATLEIRQAGALRTMYLST